MLQNIRASAQRGMQERLEGGWTSPSRQAKELDWLKHLSLPMLKVLIPLKGQEQGRQCSAPKMDLLISMILRCTNYASVMHGW
eukprot:scaffold203012_cov19-Tisochrysis_lutea.AAC.7